MRSVKSIVEAKDERIDVFIAAVAKRDALAGSTLSASAIQRMDGGNLWIGVNAIGFDILMARRRVLSEEATRLFMLQEITIEIHAGTE